MVAESGVISYPTPLYQNAPIQSDFYLPQRFVIEHIALGLTTTVTTQDPHDYVIGQLIRLIIPCNFGSYQLNNVKGYVLSIPASDQVVVDIDSSTNVDPFLPSATVTTAYPQILAIGDINSGVVNSSGRQNNQTFIDGSFINVSPQ